MPIFLILFKVSKIKIKAAGRGIELPSPLRVHFKSFNSHSNVLLGVYYNLGIIDFNSIRLSITISAWASSISFAKSKLQPIEIKPLSFAA